VKGVAATENDYGDETQTGDEAEKVRVRKARVFLF